MQTGILRTSADGERIARSNNLARSSEFKSRQDITELMGSNDNISVGDIIRFLEGGNVEVDFDVASDNTQTPFEMKPRDFLEYAQFDFTHDYDHHLVNALTNAKRAIACQIDSLLHTMILWEKSRSENWNSPRKIDTLNRLGIITPPIISRINRKRNFLEHEYRKNTREEVEDAVGVAQLFINYTDKHLVDRIGRVVLYSGDCGHQIRLDLDRMSKGISVEAEEDDEMHHRRFVGVDSEEYVEMLGMMVRLTTRINVE